LLSLSKYSGLLSQKNIELLEKENLDFILGARLKSLPEEWKDRILDNKDYDKKVKDEEVLRITAFPYTANRRLIVSHSTKRAELVLSEVEVKDHRDREKAIDKLRQKLEKSKKPEYFDRLSNHRQRLLPA
jgi:hypothetical protein